METGQLERKPPARRRRNLWDRIWKDKDGQVVIWQNPSPLLWGWAGLTTLSLFLDRTVADVVAIAGDVSLALWSLLEIFKGANYFRRLLGLLVLMFAVALFFKTLS